MPGKPILSYTVAILAMVLSTLLCIQGFQGRFPFVMDSLINVDQTVHLLDEGVFPDRGGIASTGGFNPPGMSWLYIPGVLTKNVYLYPLVGAVICHVLTLWGIYLLALRAADPRTALWAVVFYGFSTLGMHFGSSLWPRAFPVAFVWMTLFLLWWRQTGNSWALGASIFCYAAGNYMFMEFLPAGAGLAWVVLTTKKPVKFLPILVCVAASVALWFPYLSRQIDNDFIDVRKQLFQKTPHSEVADAFNPYREKLLTRNPETKQLEPFQYPPEPRLGSAGKLFFRIYYAFRNFSGRIIYNTNAFGIGIYFAVACCACGWLFTYGNQRGFHLKAPLRYGIGSLLLLGGIVCNPWLGGAVLGRSLDDEEAQKIIQVALVFLIVGAGIFPNSVSTKLLSKITAVYGDAATQTSESQLARATIWQCFLPSLVCVSVAAIVLKYTWWLWGVECVIISLAVSYFPRNAGLSSIKCGFLEVLTAGLIFCNSTAYDRVTDFWQNGFWGKPTENTQLLDRFAQSLRDQGRDAVGIGYSIYFNGYELLGWNHDKLYRLGAPQDLYFLHKFGLRNTTRQPQGYSDSDEYRIVETDGSAAKSHVFKKTDYNNFRLVDETPSLQLWERIP